jgi:hypothetical protein
VSLLRTFSLQNLPVNINLLSTSHNEPEQLVQKEVNKANAPAKEPKLNYLQNYLASMKSGTKVFQHFLANSNLSQVLEGKTPTGDDSECR